MDSNSHHDNPPHGRERTVLFVAPQAFFTPSGTPINVLNMCRCLCEEGYQVHILTLPSGADVDLENLVYHRVVRIPFIRKVPVGFSIAKLIYDFVIAVQLIALLARRRFLSVHALEESAFFAAPIARCFQVPLIVDLDSDLTQQLRAQPSRLGRWLAGPSVLLRGMALRGAHYAVTVAPYLTTLVQRESPSTRVMEIRDIPLEAALRKPDAAARESFREELGLPSDAPILVYTGNFDQRQGLSLLIEAMPEVRARYSSCKLLLVGGDRSEIEELNRLAEALSCADTVVFAGHRPPQLMPEAMGIASVLLSPRLEPHVTPLKIYSYMASGRPIVATDLPTHSTVVDRECAVLVPPTVAGIVQGICMILSDPELGECLGARARERVLVRHSYEIFKRQMLDLYATLEYR